MNERLTDEALSRCEWCGEGVYPDHDRFECGNYRWHDDCGERVRSMVVDENFVGASTTGEPTERTQEA